MHRNAPDGRSEVAVGTSPPHLDELRRRVLGYTFGGPHAEWCEPTLGGGMPLPTDPRSPQSEIAVFRGCQKYATCDLIPESSRWTPWPELTEDQRQQLRTLRCYRASATTAWDAQATPSRFQRGPDGRWVGNPFGLRTPELVASVRETTDRPGPDGTPHHRDLQPCPVGGCVTPEMQRDYMAECAASGDPAPSLGRSHVCPFFYRHTSDALTHALPNPLRFAQCYVTLPAFRRFLKDAGVVVVAPVHRSPEGASDIGDSYWYPFYSGYAFLQVPTRAPSDDGSTDPTLAPRWLLTRIARQRRYRSAHKLPVREIFRGAESGLLTTAWEREKRLVSVSEGQASLFLLQWVLARRLASLLRSTRTGTVPIDIVGTLEWRYAQRGDPFFSKLAELEGVGYDLADLFGLIRRDGEYVRAASLHEDLQLLGLLDDSGVVTQRLTCAVRWLAARLSWAASGAPSDREVSAGVDDPGGLDEAVLSWLGPCAHHAAQLVIHAGEDQTAALPSLVQLLLAIASRGVVPPPHKSMGWPELEHMRLATQDPTGAASAVEHWLNDENPGGFSHVCRLVPQMHILVRARWTTPLRWMFVPTAVLAQPVPGGRTSFRVSSGLIAMVEDDIAGLPYQLSSEDDASRDAVLTRFESVLPVLSFLSAVELGCLQDDIIDAYREWEARRPRISQAVHFLREVRDDLRRLGTETAKEVGELVDVLAGQFFVQLTPPVDAVRRGPEAVDASRAAHEAVASFNKYYGSRYCVAELSISDEIKGAKIDVIPYEQRYTQDEKLSSRAYDALRFLLLDLLAQRAPYTGGEPLHLKVVSEVSGACSFVLLVPGDFGFDWSYPETELGELPRGRGLNNTFGTAVALGAVRAGCGRPANAPGTTEVFVSFTRSSV